MSTGTTGLTTPPRLGRGGAGTLAETAAATGSARRRNPNRRMRWAGLLYLAPALAMYTWVVLVPLVQSVQYSFYTWDGVSTPTWVGFGNYVTFVTDPVLRSTLGARRWC